MKTDFTELDLREAIIRFKEYPETQIARQALQKLRKELGG